MKRAHPESPTVIRDAGQVTFMKLNVTSQHDGEKELFKHVLRLSDSLTQIFIDRKISNLALELLSKFHLSNGLNFWDAIIAASVLDSKLVLVTENIKHFRFIVGLQVVSQKEAFATL